MDLSIHWGHGKREEDVGHKIICFSAMSLNLYFLFDPGCSFHFTLCKGVTGEGTQGPGSAVCSNNFTIFKKMWYSSTSLSPVFWSTSYSI